MTPVNTTTKYFYYSICNSITDKIGDTREKESIARLLLEHYLGLSYTEIHLDKDILINSELRNKILISIARLNRGEPIQYIFGYTYFMGRKFIVNRSVLIPRSETEELVYHIIKNNRINKLSVLDIGTGSGCIAISLKKELLDSKVHAIDIDENALTVATLNSVNLDADVCYINKDILKAISLPQKYDIIVSNPPYVLECEKAYMKENVLNYEPHKALFVPTHDGLIFYRKIVELATKSLTSQGKIYFEINEAFGKEVFHLLHTNGFININIHRDIHNKERVIEACYRWL